LYTYLNVDNIVDVLPFEEHPWLREGGEASDKPIDSAVLSRMKQFRAMNKLKKLALKVRPKILHLVATFDSPLYLSSYRLILTQVIAENIDTEEIQGLKAMFANIDTDNSGTITYEELKEGLAKLGSRLTEAEVKQLMDAVSFDQDKIVHLILECLKTPIRVFVIQADVDGNGSIDYIEFTTATMHRHRLESNENVYKAFQHFDKDGSG